MSSQSVIHDLRGGCANTFEIAPVQDTHQVYLPDAARSNFPGLQDTALDDIAGSTGEKEKGKYRATFLDILTNLLDILFPGHWRETYHRVEGEEMPPILVYRLGNLYHVSEDGRRRFAATRYERNNFIQADVWEQLSGWR